MYRSIFRLLAVVAVVFAPLSSSAAAGIYMGSITSADRAHANALQPTGSASTCATPKPVPGTLTNSFLYRYDSYGETNTSGAPRCVTVQLAVGATTASDGAFFAAYLDSFNASNLAANYLGDAGIRVAPGTTRSYSVNVPAGRRIVVVVEEYTPGTGVPSYTLTITGIVPTPVLVRSFVGKRES
jgi:hypothetical protein